MLHSHSQEEGSGLILAAALWWPHTGNFISESCSAQLCTKRKDSNELPPYLSFTNTTHTHTHTQTDRQTDTHNLVSFASKFTLRRKKRKKILRGKKFCHNKKIPLLTHSSTLKFSLSHTLIFSTVRRGPVKAECWHNENDHVWRWEPIQHAWTEKTEKTLLNVACWYES